MKTTFLEIVLQSRDFHLSGRDEIEDPLDEALREAQLGEVTGGGSGAGSSNIDVEVLDLPRGLEIIRRILQELGCAKSTCIIQYYPNKIIHEIYEVT